MTTHLPEMKKKLCRYCDGPLGEPFLKLGDQPLANSFTKASAEAEEFLCPLDLVLCGRCYLVQLSHVVPPERMFSHYLYVSSTTATFREHFALYAKDLKNRLHDDDGRGVAVDIGSNDGLLVSCYAKEGLRAVGVEPAKNLSDDANAKGIPTINRPFDDACAEEILEAYGRADIVSGNNVFAHIDDIAGVCRNINRVLKDSGIFVIEFPYLLTMLDEMLFDMIYHEHLSYIAINPLAGVLERHDLRIFDIAHVPSHGGSCRVFIQRKNGPYETSERVGEMLKNEVDKGLKSGDTYKDFADRVHKVKEDLTGFLARISKENKTISGYGAPAKASTIINYCGFTPGDIAYIVDDNPLKQDTFTPGAKIPIYNGEHLKNNPTDYVMIFAWNFAEEIMKKIAYLREKGVKFIVPLPSPKIH